MEASVSKHFPRHRAYSGLNNRAKHTSSGCTVGVRCSGRVATPMCAASGFNAISLLVWVGC
jgi:hypothetical protein